MSSIHHIHTIQDLVIFSSEQGGVGLAPSQAPVQSFSANSATFCLDRTCVSSFKIVQFALMLILQVLVIFCV